jgi:hypothetical protein
MILASFNLKRAAFGRLFLLAASLGRLPLLWAHEQRTIAMLAEGVSTALCDPVAVLTLRRIGLVTGSQLTPAAEQMLSAAVRRAFAAYGASVLISG